MCFKMGGACFLIPYCLSLFTIAMPMYLVETMFGQLIKTKMHQRYGMISHAWWAISVSQAMVCFFTTIYYVTLMAWSFSFFLDALRDPIPWAIIKEEFTNLTSKNETSESAAQQNKTTELWNP